MINSVSNSTPRYFYVFVNIDELTIDTTVVPVVELPFYITSDMNDIVEDCFAKHIKTKHAAYMRLNSNSKDKIFTYCNRNVNADVLNVENLNIFTKLNGNIIPSLAFNTRNVILNEQSRA